MFVGAHRFLPVLTVCWVSLAGFLPADAQCSADPWADWVVVSSMTSGDPLSVLGAPDGVLADFEEVGSDPGFVTVVFTDDVIADGPGADFIVHVVDFPQSEFIEAFEVLVSEDGTSFVSLGMVFPTLLMGDLPEPIAFDLAGSGLASVTHVTVRGLNVDPIHQGEGVDIDAFEAINCDATVDTDLEACLDDLDACQIDSGACEGDLEICNDGFDACREDLGAAQGELATCRDDLRTIHEAIDEGAAGLAEIHRLIALPPGQRESSFACSGELCAEIQEAIRMLLAPPGQNVRRGGAKSHPRR